MEREVTVTRSGVIFCLSLVLVANYNLLVHAQTPQEIAKKAFGSVVLLVMEDDNGQSISLGSGFFVLEGVIATNLHVVEGASRGYAKLIGQKTRIDIEGSVGIDSLHDLVLLKISSPRTASLPLGNSDAVEVGDPVYAVGNPQGLEGTFSQGIVSSVRQVGTEKLLQITAPISPGSSGGPVLNSQGEVIGVAVATFKGGQNLNFAIPSNYLKMLSDKPQTVVPLVNTKPSPRQRSIFSDLGGRSTEGVVGKNFTFDSYVQEGEYSFSLVNKLREPVKNLYCLVVFYDTTGSPIDFSVIAYSGIIPPGLVKRVKGRVEGIVEQLNSPPLGGFHGAHPSWRPPRAPRSRIEIRILDFQIVE